MPTSHSTITYPAILAFSMIITFAFLISLIGLYITFYAVKIVYYSIKCHGYAMQNVARSAGRKPSSFDYFEFGSMQRFPYDHKKDEKVIFHRICRS